MSRTPSRPRPKEVKSSVIFLCLSIYILLETKFESIYCMEHFNPYLDIYAYVLEILTFIVQCF